MSLAHLQGALQRRTLQTLGEVIRGGEPVALLDYPLHLNAGDTLIYVGELAYLERLGVPVRYQTTASRYRADEVRRLHPEGPILLHGGGNFGDRWAHFQSFRERVIADFPDRKIVQLPQSMEMSVRTAARVNSRYGTHSDLTVLLRESRSMRRAAELLPDVQTVFCPDLAFGYRPALTERADVDVLELRRTDSESAVSDELFTPDHEISLAVTDWSLSTSELIRWHLVKSPGSVVRRVPRLSRLLYPRFVDPSYQRTARLVLRAAERTIGQGRVVVTDRLHAAILATLMGRAVVARDNINGKISAVFDDYLGLFPSVMMAESAEAAGQMVRSLLRE